MPYTPVTSALLPRRSAILGAFALVSLLFFSGRARAQSACVIKGAAPMAKTTEVFSAASGGDVIAKFTGQPISMSVTIPATSTDRGAVQTGGSGKNGGFRIDGFVDVTAVPAITTKNIPVVAGVVWIGGARTVQMTSAAAGSVGVKMAVGAPIEQTLTTTSPCDGLSLDSTGFTQAGPPGNARGYVAKKAPLAVRSSAGGDVVFTFTSSSISDALLFWSTEQKSGYVHALLGGDVVIDGWIASSDLKALPQGEMLGAISSSSTSIGSAKLMMQGTPQTAKPTKDVTIRKLAKDDAAAIGMIESGCEVIVMETILGWSNVLPSHLAIMPPDGSSAGFWVKTSELGIK